jgi:predicted SnoaL-like aldol condensation-catalyzing enzyme
MFNRPPQILGKKVIISLESLTPIPMKDYLNTPTVPITGGRTGFLKTTAEENKALVLKAFDVLFNQRDYEAAASFWSEDYLQHSSHIEPGRDGLFNLVRSLPDTLRYEKNGRLAEHWDVLQDKATEAQSKSGLPMFGDRFPA